MRQRLLLGLVVGAMAAAVACGSSDEDGLGDLGGVGAVPGAEPPGTGATGVGGAGSGDDRGEPALPPEQELEMSFRAPVATGRFLWTANPASGRVAYIDTRTFEITTTEAGLGPTYLTAVNDEASTDAAFVLNVQSRDATLLSVDGEGELTSTTVPTHANANSWKISASGDWAVAWTDARAIPEKGPTDSFQEVTLIDLRSDEATSTRISVGYRPRSVAFDADETTAYVVTEPGISRIDLASGTALSQIEVSDDPLVDPATSDVSITPGGAFALVRANIENQVALVDLKAGTRTTLTFPGAVTDLDLAADGKTAVAVLRARREVALFPVAPNLTDGDVTRTVVDGQQFGSVSLTADLSQALLYTNAVEEDRVTVLTLTAGADYLATRTVALKAPVDAVFPSPDGSHAIAFQRPGSVSAKPGAFSVVPTTVARSAKIVGTDAPPTNIAFSPDGAAAVVTVRDDAAAVFGVYLVRMPSLAVDFIPLASAPLAAGVVADTGFAYVAQQHPEGRISFLNLESGAVRTITGFELASKVVD